MNVDKSEYRWAIVAIGAALVALFIAAGLIGAFGHTVPTQLWAAGGALSGALVGVLVPAPKSKKNAEAAGASTGAAMINSAALSAAIGKAKEIESDRQSTPQDREAARTAVAEVADTAAEAPGLTIAAAIPAAINVHQDAAAQAAQAAQPAQEDAAAQGAQAAQTPGQAVKQEAAEAAAATRNAAVAQANARATVSTPHELLKVLIPTIIFATALTLGILISDGTIGYANCPVTMPVANNTTQAPCSTTLFQTGNALITLAASAGGALVALFAPTPSSAAPAQK